MASAGVSGSLPACQHSGSYGPGQPLRFPPAQTRNRAQFPQLRTPGLIRTDFRSLVFSFARRERDVQSRQRLRRRMGETDVRHGRVIERMTTNCEAPATFVFVGQVVPSLGPRHQRRLCGLGIWSQQVSSRFRSPGFAWCMAEECCMYPHSGLRRRGSCHKG